MQLRSFEIGLVVFGLVATLATAQKTHKPNDKNKELVESSSRVDTSGQVPKSVAVLQANERHAYGAPVNDNCIDSIDIFDGFTAWENVGANTDGTAFGDCGPQDAERGAIGVGAGGDRRRR